MTTIRSLRIVPAVLGVLAALVWGLTLIRPPAGTAAGLDQSWRVALTLAAEQHLRFGEQILFTFGPLGYALQGLPDPGLAVATALVQGVLAVATVAGVVTLLGGRGGFAAKVAFVLAALALSSAVAIDDVAAVGALALVARAARFPRTALAAGVAVGAIALIGLLSKYTLGIDALAAASAAWAVDAVRGPRRRRRVALLAAAGCWTVTALGLVVAFGFSPRALGAYVGGAAEISAGFSGAMGLAGPSAQITVALIVAAAIVVVCAVLARQGGAGVAAAAAVLLFLVWKHGFVRQDGHVIYYFATAPAIAAILAIAVRKMPARALALATTALALGALAWVWPQVWNTPPRLLDAARVTAGFAFLRNPVATEAAARAAVGAALAPDLLSPELAARLRPGGTDVLPWETAIVEANGLRWSPLPVFQTYSAYTPALDALDRNALAAHGAEHVLYRYVAIDGRAPFGDAPATIAALACRYWPEAPRVTTAANEPYLLLRRDPGGFCLESAAGSVPAQLNAPITVPPAGSPSSFITASVVVHPSLGTRAATALWRPAQLDVVVRFDDGTERRYRTVPATLGDGMIVSASPRDDDEVARFFEGEAVHAVRTITFVARPGTYVLERVAFRHLLRVR
ncbi:MAG TPA: hypothetical protein VHS78_07740 [Candidatus Elarobacter sp.]|nr:hypothetical protein [Candidatus Elarobacter sp.]